MRIVLSAAKQVWIMFVSQSLKEYLDTDSDDGPQKKHRRLTYEQQRRKSPSSMENEEPTERYKCSTPRNKRPEKHSKGTSTSSGTTREIGTFCTGARDLLPMNDKCVMVGTTGIAALKAKYGDDFSNFEIIQDVGYSSESSTHLSSDDIGEHVHEYSFTPPRRTDGGLSYSLKSVFRMKEDSENTDEPKGFGPSSLGSSASHNDSGLGTLFCDGEIEAALNGRNLNEYKLSDDCDDISQDELEDFIDFSFIFPEFQDDPSSANESLHDGFDSDVSDDLLNRSSFMSDAQLFYKMTSVDSETGDLDSPDKDNSVTWTEDKLPSSDNESLVHELSSTEEQNSLSQNLCSKCCSNGTKESHTGEEEVVENSDMNFDSDLTDGFMLEVSSHRLSSSPVRQSHRERYKYRSSLQKRGQIQRQRRRKIVYISDSNVRSEAKKITSTRTNRCLTHSRKKPDFYENVFPWRSAMNSPHHQLPSPVSESDSSCDASGEYSTTTESDDNGSLASSLDDNEMSYSSVSRSGRGSADTIIPLELELKYTDALGEPVLLLPPPPPPTPHKHKSSNESLSDNSLPTGRKPQSLSLKANSVDRLDAIYWNSKGNKHVENHGSNSNQRPLSVEASALDFPPPLDSIPSAPSCCQTKKKSQSLPTLLPSDSFQSSTSDHCHSHSTSRPKSFPSDLFRKRTKSKRRARRASSSSNRSRNGSRGRCPISTEFSTRKRHWSQVQTPTQSKGLKAISGRLPTVRCCNPESPRVTLASPESDVVLTHLEEQSTVSDQVWDGYQEMPYLSEAYSEPTVDEDAVRKLTEFGDDYGAVIGQSLLHRLDSNPIQSFSSSSSTFISESGTTAMKTTTSASDKYTLDSDSDVEDLYSVLEDSYKALQYAKCSFKDGLTDSEIAELRATCETHLTCLQSIQELVKDNEDGMLMFSDVYNEQLHDLIEKWDKLGGNIQMSQMVQALKQDIDELHNKILDLSIKNKLRGNNVSSVDDIKTIMDELQMALSYLMDIKPRELLALNVRVHRYVTHNEDSPSSLKDDVAKLYRLWDDAYEQNFALLTDFHAISNRWDIYHKKYDALDSRLEEMPNASVQSDEPTAYCESLKSDLEDLHQDEASLHSVLSEYDLWATVEQEARQLDRKVGKVAAVLTAGGGDAKFTQEDMSSAFESVSHPKPSASDEDEQDEKLEDAVSGAAVGSKGSPRSSASRFWRVIRIALPIQVSLVVLCCLAVVLEPHCCSLLNNMNFSFIPHLRYYRGPPPV